MPQLACPPGDVDLSVIASVRTPRARKWVQLRDTCCDVLLSITGAIVDRLRREPWVVNAYAKIGGRRFWIRDLVNLKHCLDLPSRELLRVPLSTDLGLNVGVILPVEQELRRVDMGIFVASMKSRALKGTSRQNKFTFLFGDVFFETRHAVARRALELSIWRDGTAAGSWRSLSSFLREDYASRIPNGSRVTALRRLALFHALSGDVLAFGVVKQVMSDPGLTLLHRARRVSAALGVYRSGGVGLPAFRQSAKVTARMLLEQLEREASSENWKPAAVLTRRLVNLLEDAQTSIDDIEACLVEIRGLKTEIFNRFRSMHSSAFSAIEAPPGAGG